MSTIRKNKGPSRTDFGFNEIKATANFDRFLAWCADRCLLPSGFKKPLRAVETATPAIEVHAISKKAA